MSNALAPRQKRIRPEQQADLLAYSAKVLWDTAGGSVAATCQMPLPAVHEIIVKRFPFASPAHVYKAICQLGTDRVIEVTSKPGTKAGNIYKMTEATRALANNFLHPLPSDPSLVHIDVLPPVEKIASELAPVHPIDAELSKIAPGEQAKIDRLYQLAEDLLLAGDAAKYKALYETAAASAELANEEIAKLTRTNQNLIGRINELRHTKTVKPAPDGIIENLAQNKRQLQAVGRLLEALFLSSHVNKSDFHGTPDINTVRALERAGVSNEQVRCYYRMIYDLVGKG